MNAQDLLREIKANAESGLMGGTWPIADRLANMQEALEQIVKLCNASPDNNPIMTILKEVAQEHTLDNDGMNLECVFCNGDCDYTEERVDDIAHEANCPTVLARAILKENGTPLHLYQIAYKLGKEFRTGFSEEEVKGLYSSNRSNLQITYERDM